MQLQSTTTPRRAFDNYVRGVFAAHLASRRKLRAIRARLLQRLERPTTDAAEQRWEGEGGSTD